MQSDEETHSSWNMDMMATQGLIPDKHEQIKIETNDVITTAQEEEQEQERVDDKAFPKSDLILVVEDQELFVNSDMLKQASPVFRAKLESEFKEDKGRIELPGKYKAMVEFLKCTYPFINSYITANNILLILPLAVEYRTDLKGKCEKFMINILRGDEKFFTHKTHDSTKVSFLPLPDVRDANRSSTSGKKSRNVNHSSSPFGIPANVSQPGPFFGSNLAGSNTGNQLSFGTSTGMTLSCPDARNLDSFLEPGFGRSGFDQSNDVSADLVITYLLAAEKYGLERLLIVCIQYIAMQRFSDYETEKSFKEISIETRCKIAMLRVRILENFYNL